jgi:hypothetical protein
VGRLVLTGSQETTLAPPCARVSFGGGQVRVVCSYNPTDGELLVELGDEQAVLGMSWLRPCAEVSGGGG